MTWKLAFLSLWRRPLRYGLLILLTAVACALPVFVIQLAGGLYEGLNRATAPFPILVKRLPLSAGIQYGVFEGPAHRQYSLQ